MSRQLSNKREYCTCDICGKDDYYNGKVVNELMVFMCKSCFDKHGVMYGEAENVEIWVDVDDDDE